MEENNYNNKIKKSTIFYSKNGVQVPENEATNYIYSEFDENGQIINETFGYIDHETAKKQVKPSMSDEEIEKLEKEYEELRARYQNPR